MIAHSPALLKIIGPTATGKTNLAFELADTLKKKYSGVAIISADSRQVYQGMEIGTGADVPSDFFKNKDTDLLYPFFSNGTIDVHGMSMISPHEEWSVEHFRQMARSILQFCQQKNFYPVVVGGTGLYHDHLFSTETQLSVGPNSLLREKAAKMSVTELQNWLNEVNPTHFNQMNHSDQMNPRRLIRSIEVSLANTQPEPVEQPTEMPDYSEYVIGLTAPTEILAERIEQRVKMRFEHEMIAEVQKLMADFSDQEWHDLPAFSATGYKEVRAYLEEKIDKEQLIELWARRELQYAKRQLTWWKKRKVDLWCDVTTENWQSELEKELHFSNSC